jgi:hypothetical protein
MEMTTNEKTNPGGPESGDRFRFRRYGSSFQMRIEDASDLRCVLELDEALWVTTSAPIRTINCDPVFLDLIDTNSDGRIRCSELREAISWLFDHLKDTRSMEAGERSIALSAIRTESEEGQRIIKTATKIFRRLDSAGSPRISLEKVRAIKKEEEGRAVSEAGIVLPQAAEEKYGSRVRDFLSDVISSLGGDPHPGGSRGVSLPNLEKFLNEARTYLEWLTKVSQSSGEPLGDKPAAAYSLLESLRDKLDEYFALCDAVRLSPEIADLLSPRVSDLEKLDFTVPETVESLLVKAPLSPPREDGVFRFDDRANPFYAEKLEAFRSQIFEPAEGQQHEMTRVQWMRIKGKFASYRNWLGSKPATRVESLGAQKLKSYLEDPIYEEAARSLIDESKTTAFVLDNIRLLEKLVLYQAYLIPFSNSFVSFPDLYNPERRALFERGTLVIDGRHYNLSIQVHDRSQHAKATQTSNMMVLYVEVGSKTNGGAHEVAVPVTSRGRGNLHVGKRGIFLETDGRELDANVVQIVENPISLSEAMVAPFQRLARVITGKFEKITTAAEEKLDSAGGETVTKMYTALETTPPAPTPMTPSPIPALGGLVAGGGIALAAVGSSAAFMAKTLAGLSWTSLLVGLVAAVSAVIVPASIVAALKLRKRDLSTILEASGWAINARMRLTRSQARFFTRVPDYPAGARGIRRRYWWAWLLLIAAFIALVLFGLSFGFGA